MALADCEPRRDARDGLRALRFGSHQVLLQHAVLGEDDVARAGDRVYVYCSAEGDDDGGRTSATSYDEADRIRVADVVVRRRRRRTLDRILGLAGVPAG